MSSARAVTRVTVDWSKITSIAHKPDLPKLNKLKARMDSTAVVVNNLPESLPKIDWATYKAQAADPKMVEEIEKKYSNIKVETPKAPQKRLDELKLAQMQDETRFQRYKEYAKSYIESADYLKKKFEDMIPIKDMTMEDWTMTFPHWSFSIENPSCHPHYGRTPGLSREEAAAFEQPDPIPYATKTAWKEWEARKKNFL